MSDEPRVTNRDIDQRVASLEETVGGVKIEMAVIRTEQGHLRELLTSGFGALGARLDLLFSKLEKLTDDVEDPGRTVAGRGLHSRLELVERKAELQKEFISQASGARIAVRVMAGILAGVLGGVATLAGVLAAVGAFR